MFMFKILKFKLIYIFLKHPLIKQSQNVRIE